MNDEPMYSLKWTREDYERWQDARGNVEDATAILEAVKRKRDADAAEPKIEVITAAGFGGCVFDLNGYCATCLKYISEHSAITRTETMTREEARRRYPDTKWPEDE